MIPGNAEARILIVEDEATHRFFLEKTLRNAGYTRIEQAGNGNEGYQKTLRFQPDLVVLDLVMPICDGIEYCHRIRAHPEFAELPVLVQTGIGDLKTNQQAFEAGATDLLTKPIHGEEFLARTNAHLERRFLASRLKERQEEAQREQATLHSLRDALATPEPHLLEAETRYGLRLRVTPRREEELVCDLLPLGTHTALFYACHFAGTGAEAALLAMRFRVLLRARMVEVDDPATLLSLLHEKLEGDELPSPFAAVLLGVVDTAADTLRFSGAGIAPAPSELPAPSAYTTHSTAFAAGDHLALEGILELERLAQQ
jgi:sigma-B regulation protein RsbU (phosphoserine phosphatase)